VQRLIRGAILDAKCDITETTVFVITNVF